jgi:hypothetical protein
MHVSDISRRLFLVFGAALLVVGGLAGSAIAGGFSAASAAPAPVTAAPGAASARPCDIYAAGRTPCVAAYSTVRALYRDYQGPLYQVRRGSDGTSTDIGVQQPGGYADAARQGAFCAGTVCTITRLYDQGRQRRRRRTDHPVRGAAAGHRRLHADAPGGIGPARHRRRRQ